jgi:hypothetical protein
MPDSGRSLSVLTVWILTLPLPPDFDAPVMDGIRFKGNGNRGSIAVKSDLADLGE